MRLGFAKANQKITPKPKCGRGPGLGNFPKLGVPMIISATTEDSDFKISSWWCLPKFIIKSHPKLGELLKIWGFPLIFMQWLNVSTFKFGTFW